ncbi:MAG: CD1247 N-terminal domain-containing protein [Oscillospiraceae bacterium]|jgi:hypothetical protein
MELTDKVSYLKGLMDGLKIDDSTNEGKVLLQVVEILGELSKSIELLSDEVDEVVELVDILDEDLGELEDDYFNLDDDDEDDDLEELDSDEDFYEVICPSCGDTICLDEEMLAEGSIDCPNCHENLEFDFDDEDSED